MKRRTDCGFTLLEVLAAVAILGIWFVVLANVAIQGLRAEGENERRMRASLVADRVLADLELGFDVGELPPETDEELEEDEFTIRIESGPLAGLELAEGGASPEEDTNLMSLVEGDLAALSTDLYAIEVSVTWTEGVAEEVVRRTTYYWDSTALMEALRNSAPADEEPEEGEAPDGDPEADA